jgi:MFS family permease
VRGWAERLKSTDQPFVRAFRSADFRLLWIGAFVSFTGGMVQNVAQGYVVFEKTGSNAKLAFVTFAFMVPMSVLSPFSGVVADLFDRRRVLVLSMALSAIGPAWLAFAAFTGRVEYWHFVAVALAGGMVQTFEVPTRQAVVRSVVPPQDLPGAIPAQAMTFNLARVAGPALGGIVYAVAGPWLCFALNALSYGALAGAAMALRADLSPPTRTPQPIGDLLTEGVRFVFRDPSLRLLFMMEAATSVLGTFYISQAAALTSGVWGLDARGLGVALTCVGVGAVAGLTFNAAVSGRQWRTSQALAGMLTVAVALVLLSQCRSAAWGMPVLALLGAGVIVQFNSTNALFQMLSSDKLRGRVLSMHIWAISGLAPLGVIAFGWVSEAVGLPNALLGGGLALLTAWVLALASRSQLREP